MNPSLEKSELKLEELYTIKFLENLGITQDNLILSNLSNDSNYNTNIKQNTLMNNLISNKNQQASLALKFQTRQSGTGLTPEIKQSINGTYRILFHCIQKKLRKENSSELESNSYFNKEFNKEFSAFNSSKLKRNSFDSNGVSLKNTNKMLSHDGKEQDDYEISMSEKSSGDKNSIFVKLNNPNGAVNVNNNSIFVKYNANAKPQNSYSSRNTSVKTDYSSRDKNSNPSHKNEANFNKHQSSKFCSIL